MTKTAGAQVDRFCTLRLNQGVHFSIVFFTKLAQAFGVDGVHLTAEKNLEQILRKYQKQKKSVIIDVPVEYAVRD